MKNEISLEKSKGFHAKCQKPEKLEKAKQIFIRLVENTAKDKFCTTIQIN